jgi:hypothetical protein
MASEQLDSLLSDRAREDFQLIKESAPMIKASLEAIAAGNDKLAASEGKRAGSTKGLGDKVAELTKAEKEHIRVVEALNLATSEQGKELAVMQKRLLDTRKANREYANSLTETTDAYKKLDNEHKKLERDAKIIGALFTTNSKQFKEAAAAANLYGNKLKEIDAALGRHQRNVGNYASGLNSTNQILRELPNAGISASTFILSLSNQIGQITDDIGRLKKENADLMAQGQKGTPIWKSFAASIFSWQTVLFVAVAAIIAYREEIAEFITSTFKGAEAIDKLAKTTELLTKGESAFIEASKQISEMTENIRLAKDGIVDKERVLKIYNEGLGKTMGTLTNFSELEQKITEAGPAYIRMMLLRASAHLALDEAAKKVFEAEQERQKSLLHLRRLAAGAEDKNQDAEGRGIDQFFFIADQKAMKAAEKAAKKNIKDLEDIANNFFREASDIAKGSNFDILSGGGITEANKPKVDKQHDNLLKRWKQTLSELAALFRNGNFSQDIADTLDSLNSSNESGIAINVRLRAEEGQLQKDLQAIDNQLNAKLTEAHSKFNRGQYKNQEDYEKDILALAADYGLKKLGVQIEYNKRIMGLLDPQTEEYKRMYAQLLDLQEQYEKKKVENTQKGNKRSLKETKQLVEDIIRIFNIAGTLTNELANLGNTLFDKKIAQYDEEGKAIDKNLEKSIKAIEYQGIIDGKTAKEVAELKMAAEKKAEAQRQDIDKKRRYDQARAARFNRAANISNIIGTTALAVITALTDKELPYYLRLINSIGAGLIGGVQVANAMAAPLPAYAEGTKNHPGGRALIGEGGERELVQEPGGRSWIADRPMIANLPSGTRVIPEHDLMMAGYGALTPMLVNRITQRETKEIELSPKTVKAIGKAVSHRTNQSVTVQGVDVYKLKHIKGRA